MLRQRTASLALAALILALATAQTAPAAEKTTTAITVQVKDMHCADCAKKIARKLYAVPGVVKVKTDLKKHLAVITPEAERQPSPKALWEAVEKAGFEPVLVAGPAGKYRKEVQ